MPFDYEDMYQRRFREAYKKNVKDVVQAAKSGDLDKKLETFCSLHGYAKEEIIREIEQNEIVATCFAINPNKQNFYKKEAARFIERLNGVRTFQSPSTRPKTVIANGEIVVLPDSSNVAIPPQAKTIDFRWEYKGRKFLACHKYTKESGGAQDQQFNEFRRAIGLSNLNLDDGVNFIAIVDGPYFDGRLDHQHTSRKEMLRAQTTENSFVCNIGELQDLLALICS